MARAHVIIPLAILEAMQEADYVPDDDVGPIHVAAGAVKFGGSATVAAQVARYRSVARGHGMIDAGEVTALLRLVSRRRDAIMVFADAGRRAGRYAARRAAAAPRCVFRFSPAPVRRRVGARLARGVAREVFDIEVLESGGAVWRDEAQIGSPEVCGAACELFGAATAELLRRFTPFDGALFHTTCRGTGGQACRWDSSPERGSAP